MPGVKRRGTQALLMLSLLAGCATGRLEGEEDVPGGGQPEGDTGAAVEDAWQVPKDDTGTLPVDSGNPFPDDAGNPSEDLGATPAEDAGIPSQDAAAPADAGTLAMDATTPGPDAGLRVDGGRVDTGLRLDTGVRVDSGGGGGCAAPRALCGGVCTDTSTSEAHCGACNNACSGPTPVCTAGRCVAPACGSGASDCDGSMANGCEVSHRSSASCGAAPNLGTWCGDVGCGFLCGSTSARVVATQTGRASAWFRGRTNECSTCPSRIQVVFNLSVPAGVDYDLYVYDSCTGASIGRSLALAGQPDRVTIERGGDVGSDSFNWFVEVRYVSGGACANWTLTVNTRSNSATSC